MKINEFIRSIAKEKRWTISEDKKPLNIRKIINDTNQIPSKDKGQYAKERNENSLASIDEIIDMIKKASGESEDEIEKRIKNLTYFVNSAEDNFVILDVEKQCPDSLKEEFLTMDFIYAEYSVSGKGYHLVFKTPEIFNTDLNLSDITVIKGRDKNGKVNNDYEILQSHHCIFTGNEIEKEKIEKIREKTPAKDFNTFYIDQYEIYKNLKSSKRNINLIKKNLDDIYRSEDIIEYVTAHRYPKTEADFNFDLSRYEYGVASFYMRQIEKIINDFNKIREEKLDESDIIYLTYYTLIKVLPHRDKHDELRYGKPWLLYISHDLAEKNIKPNKKTNKKENRKGK